MKDQKYINVDLIKGSTENNCLSDIKPEDIIFLTHWFDVFYDHKSEDMGHFVAIGYLKNGEVRAEWFNTGEWEPISELLNRAREVLVRVKRDDDVFISSYDYFNKNKLPDLDVKSGKLIYKNKYKFNSCDDDIFIFPEVGLLADTFEEYNGKWSNDPSK